MKQIFRKFGMPITIIAGIISLFFLYIFDNIFIIAFFLSIFIFCIYVLISNKIEYEFPHVLIINYINMLERYKYTQKSSIIEGVIGLLISMDNKIATIQEVTGPMGSKKDYKEPSSQYVDKALKIARSNVEGLIAACALEPGQMKDERIEQIIGRLKYLLNTMDDLILSLSNIDYKNDAKLIQLIKDYADSLDKLN